ncbi:PSP1 C-terminal domain-containing protein [Posidoniimonas polymericola]|nr:PSP1 C-terminal domain-containing protein [Posidoniimonas polymericola]
MHHFVRVGLHGDVGRFRSTDSARYQRGRRVIVRTSRGLETGEVLSVAESAESQPDGDLLRAMTSQDHLLAERLEQRRGEAYDACVRLLAERRLQAVLMDVEHLFDGQGLYFHFLGDVPPEVEALTAELSEAYEAKAQIGRFAETLSEGCGPGCGTEEAKGQGGCDSCAGCAVASACKK